MIDFDQKNILNSAKKSDLDLDLSRKDYSPADEQKGKPAKTVKLKRARHAAKPKFDEIYYESSDMSDVSIGLSKTFKRGPYRKYSQKLKQEAVSMALKLDDPNKAAGVYQIPVKNLRRWIKLGTEKKKGRVSRWQEDERP